MLINNLISKNYKQALANKMLKEYKYYKIKNMVTIRTPPVA